MGSKLYEKLLSHTYYLITSSRSGDLGFWQITGVPKIGVWSTKLDFINDIMRCQNHKKISCSFTISGLGMVGMAS